MLVDLPVCGGRRSGEVPASLGGGCSRVKGLAQEIGGRGAENVGGDLGSWAEEGPGGRAGVRGGGEVEACRFREDEEGLGPAKIAAAEAWSMGGALLRHQGGERGVWGGDGERMAGRSNESVVR